MIQIRVIGAKTTNEYLENLRLSAVLLGTMNLTFSAGDPKIGRTEFYAFGIETGRHRGGGRARRAGGAFYMKTGWEIVRTTVGSRLARIFYLGPLAVKREMQAIGQDAVDIARGVVPFVSGDLSRSIASAFRSK